MNPDGYVVLRGGLTLPLVALKLVWELEERGIRLDAKDGDTLVVSPRSRVTDEDRAALRRWKYHVLALVTYDASAQQEQVS